MQDTWCRTMEQYCPYTKKYCSYMVAKRVKYNHQRFANLYFLCWGYAAFHLMLESQQTASFWLIF